MLAATAAIAVRRHEAELGDAARELRTLDLLLAAETARSFQSVELVLDNVAEQVKAEGAVTPAAVEERMSTRAVHDVLKARVAGVPAARCRDGRVGFRQAAQLLARLADPRRAPRRPGLLPGATRRARQALPQRTGQQPRLGHPHHLPGAAPVGARRHFPRPRARGRGTVLLRAPLRFPATRPRQHHRAVADGRRAAGPLPRRRGRTPHAARRHHAAARCQLARRSGRLRARRDRRRRPVRTARHRFADRRRRARAGQHRAQRGRRPGRLAAGSPRTLRRRRGRVPLRRRPAVGAAAALQRLRGRRGGVARPRGRDRRPGPGRSRPRGRRGGETAPRAPSWPT